MTTFEVICTTCGAKVEPIQKDEQEICPVCGFNVDAYGVEE